VTRIVTSLLWALWLGLLLFTGGWLILRLRAALTPVFFALLFAYALEPLVARFEAAHLPRSLGIAVLLCIAILLLGLFVFLVLRAVVRDLIELARTVLFGITQLATQVRPWLESHGVPVPPGLAVALDKLSDNALGIASESLAPLRDMVSAAVGGTFSLIGTIGAIVMVPVFAFYFLHDFEHIVAVVRDLLPLSMRDDVVSMAVQVDRVLADFVRGQLTVMAILAALYAVGYSLIGVPMAVPIGLLAGFLTFIPYVGSAVALVFGLLMTLLHFSSWGKILAVICVYVVIQMADGIVITPRVVGGRLGLSPVWVLFALMAFGQLFGFVGVMLALPMSAVIKVFVIDGLARYRRSELYLGKRVVAPELPPLRAARLRVRRERRDRLRFGASS
jgi:predicted PurR-regulated permease PerM